MIYHRYRVCWSLKRGRLWERCSPNVELELNTLADEEIRLERDLPITLEEIRHLLGSRWAPHGRREYL